MMLMKSMTVTVVCLLSLSPPPFSSSSDHHFFFFSFSGAGVDNVRWNFSGAEESIQVLTLFSLSGPADGGGGHCSADNDADDGTWLCLLGSRHCTHVRGKGEEHGTGGSCE